MREEFCYDEIAIVAVELDGILETMERNERFKLSDADLKRSAERINACVIRLGVIGRLMEFRQTPTDEDEEFIF